jgi:hypothetical protein
VADTGYTSAVATEAGRLSEQAEHAAGETDALLRRT